MKEKNQITEKKSILEDTRGDRNSTRNFKFLAKEKRNQVSVFNKKQILRY